MIHYHGTPVNPGVQLLNLAGRHFCVSFYDPRQVRQCHEIGQSVMLDNGAFSFWRSRVATNWPAFYAWVDPWLDCPTTWAVIPDVIDAEAEVQDALLEQWPFGTRGAPVWHMHEPVGRLLRLIDKWARVCIGSSKRYAQVLAPRWCGRMDEVWNAIARVHARTPWVHMLRGMQLAGRGWPFASGDSTDIARNHNRPQNTPGRMAARWDAVQTPARWIPRPLQQELIV